ncbi:hypothetical protein chiPu_0030482, partial [Chiloscyllium punctatum]|nr:hypothetical protein [Chiloscyllium punctatum]
MAVIVWLVTLPNLDTACHVRMQRAEILVLAGLREGEREGAVGIHGLGAEFPRAHHGVRDVVA